jgi:hypothetical protein
MSSIKINLQDLRLDRFASSRRSMQSFHLMTTAEQFSYFPLTMQAGRASLTLCLQTTRCDIHCPTCLLRHNDQLKTQYEATSTASHKKNCFRYFYRPVQRRPSGRSHRNMQCEHKNIEHKTALQLQTDETSNSGLVG